MQTEYKAIADPVEQANADTAILRQALERRARTDKDYAIEFGEYLAKAAVRLMNAQNAVDAGRMEDVDEDAQQRLEQSYSEAFGDVQNAVYEFRKRATRAGHEPSAIEFAK